MRDWRLVDWKDPGYNVSRFFTVREAIYSSRFGRLLDDRDGLTDHVKEQIVLLGDTLDQVHDFIGLPMIVHSWFRPKVINDLIGGAENSRHMCLGDWSAVDFHCHVQGSNSNTEACDILRASLEPKLEEWGLRMEKLPGAGWVHLDNAPVVFNRYFNPGEAPHAND